MGFVFIIVSMSRCRRFFELWFLSNSRSMKIGSLKNASFTTNVHSLRMYAQYETATNFPLSKTFINLRLIQYFPTRDVDYFLFTIKSTLIIHRKGLHQVSFFKTFSSALINNVDRCNFFQFVFESAHSTTKSVFR